MQTIHKEDQGDCVTVCLKYLLFVFNFLFWVSKKKKEKKATPTQTAREKKVVHWPVLVAALFCLWFLDTVFSQGLFSHVVTSKVAN